MVVDKGFKETEIGIIPNNWNVINLENHFSLKARIGWQGLTTAEYLKTGDFCLVTGTDFKNGFIDWDNCVFVEKNRYVQDKNIQLSENDVLVTKDGTIGKVAFIDKLQLPTTLNSGVFVIRPKTKTINSKFFYYVLMSFYFDAFLNRITAGSTITHLYQKDFVYFNLILPPLPEQTAIATALSDMDTLIAQTEKLIEKKKAIKQGVMQELLRPKDGWVTKKLGDYGKTYGGITGKTKADFGKGNGQYIPFMNIMSNPIIDIDFLDKVNIKSGEAQNRAMKGDLFFNGSSETPEEVGLCSVLTKDVENLYLNSFCFGYRMNSQNDLNGLFLSYLFRSPLGRNLIFSLAQGATRYNLSKTNLLKLELPIPSKTEQDNIAKILLDLDQSITTTLNKLQKLKHQKQGMMQALLTGKIRLV